MVKHASWNHRIVEFEHDGERVRAIHEVYYDANGKPIAFAERPAAIVWEGDGTRLTDVHHKPAHEQLCQLGRALCLPVLRAADFVLVDA